LATLRLDVPVFENVNELHWKGPRQEFEKLCERMKAPALLTRAKALIAKVGTK